MPFIGGKAFRQQEQQERRNQGESLVCLGMARELAAGKVHKKNRARDGR